MWSRYCAPPVPVNGQAVSVDALARETNGRTNVRRRPQTARLPSVALAFSGEALELLCVHARQPILAVGS
jgi:hypothetical protein